MTNFYNNSIIAFKKKETENFTIIYKLFENDAPFSYSMLITMSGEGEEQDFYIPAISISKEEAVRVFKKMHENLVLPSELPMLFSDDAFKDEKIVVKIS